MHFALTEEQRMIQQLAREFAQQEIAPLSAQHDREQSFPLPVHAKALEDFSQLTAKGRRVQNSPADRFSNTLNGWITDKEQPYPRITALYRYLCSQIEAAAHNKKGTPRKVNG